MSNKKLTTRDKAISHYQDAHKRLYGYESIADLSGVATETIWEVGDEYVDIANNDALDSLDEFHHTNEYSTGNAFVGLAGLIVK